MTYTKKDYEEYMNSIYAPGDLALLEEYAYLNAKRLLLEGKFGTAIRRHDPILFEVGYNEWRPSPH